MITCLSKHEDDKEEEERWLTRVAINDLLWISSCTLGHRTKIYINMDLTVCAKPQAPQGIFLDHWGHIQFPPYMMTLETDPCSEESWPLLCIPTFTTKGM